MAKLPPNVKTMARVAAGLGLAQSFMWLLLGSLALASYLNCGFAQESEEAPPPPTANVITASTALHRYFFLNEYCPGFRSEDGIVSSYELHIWSALAVTTSGLWLIISCCMFIFVTNKNMSNVNATLYSWSIVTVIVSCTDIALGVVLGVSFGTITDLMNADDESDFSYLNELYAVRTGTLILMVVALRGFVLLLINITFVVLMLYYAYLVNAALNRNEHNIHSMGPLYAYQGGKNQSEPWSTMGFEYENQHGGQVNRGYGRSEQERDRDWNQPSVRRDDSYYGRSLTRSDSWRRGKAINQPPKPFSYLEEPQMLRPQPPKAPSPAPAPSPSSVAIPPWKRRDNLDPSQPNVPSPDYSPPQNRQPRLKSALKSTAY